MNITLADRRNAELRQQQLGDEARRRQDMLTDDVRNRERTLADYTRANNDRINAAQAAVDAAREAREELKVAETEKYNARRFDHMQDSLVQGGYLAKEDVGNPTASATALKNFINEQGYQAKLELQELATAKATVEAIALKFGPFPGSDKARQLITRADLPAARTIADAGVTFAGTRSKEKNDREEKNTQGTVDAIARNEYAKAQLETQIGAVELRLSQLAQGEGLTDTEERAAQTKAQGSSPSFAKGAASADRAGYQAALATARENIIGMATMNEQKNHTSLLKRQVNLRNEDATIAVKAKVGGYGVEPTFKPTDATVNTSRPPALTAPPAAGTGGASKADYVPPGAKKVMGATGTAPPASYNPNAGTALATSATPPPVVMNPLVPQQDTPRVPTAGSAVTSGTPAWWSRDRDNAANNEAVKAAIAKVPGAVGDVIVGGAQRMNPMNFVPGYEMGVDAAYAFNPERATFLRNYNKPGTLPRFDAQGMLIDPTATAPDPRQTAAEDELLRLAPYSLRAIEIRRQRGIPQPREIEAGAMGGR